MGKLFLPFTTEETERSERLRSGLFAKVFPWRPPATPIQRVFLDSSMRSPVQFYFGSLLRKY